MVFLLFVQVGEMFAEVLALVFDVIRKIIGTVLGSRDVRIRNHPGVRVDESTTCTVLNTCTSLISTISKNGLRSRKLRLLKSPLCR